MNYSNIVVCCDGTWCGDEAGTRGNIKIIADSFAGQTAPQDGPVVNQNTNTIVRYFPGIGVLAPTLIDSTLDAVLATSIKEACVTVYKFIVESFDLGSKVWLFGLSRGAHTVRSVAGMINNLGILRQDLFHQRPVDLQCACEQVYDIYRNPDERYRPNQPWSLAFRRLNGWDTEEPPIIFMGLLDTVGALGVPKLSPGVAVSYEFYDEVVSSEVQHVYQALAMHDRCAFFTPCFVRRNPDAARYGGALEPRAAVERWFPGAHYDVGRQRFVLGRKHHGVESWLRWVLDFTNLMHLNVTYTHELSNPPLRFLIEAVKAVRPEVLPGDVNSYLPGAADPLPPTWRYPCVRPWTINAYDNIVNCTWAAQLLRLLPGHSTLQVILSEAVLSDRHVPLYGEYTPEHFWGFDAQNPQNDAWRQLFRAAPTRQKSRAFDIWEALNIP